MSSLVTNLNSSTAQEIVNWITTADGCVHSTDTTQLDFAVGKFVQTRRDCRQLVSNSVHTADATQLDSRVESLSSYKPRKKAPSSGAAESARIETVQNLEL